MNDERDNKKSITQHTKELNIDDIVNFPKPENQILWRGNVNATPIQKHRLNDPFITAHIKYFNSRFFNESCKDQYRYIKAFQAILAVLDENDLSMAPSHIFGLLLSYLKKQSFSETKIYFIYTAARTVCRRENVGSGRGVQAYSYLLSEVEYTNEEVKILREADSSAPNVLRPKYNPHPDLVTKFNLECSGDEILKSIRSFCIFYLTEWNNIRNQIYDKFPIETKEILKHPKKKLRLNNSGTIKYQFTESGKHIPTLIFDILREINNPISNEYFSSAYLNVFKKSKVNTSKIINSNYCFESLTSSSKNIDWLKEIGKQFISNKNGRIAPAQWSYSRLSTVGFLNNSRDFSVKPEWSGSLMSIPPITEIFGITTCEEICMSWLLATERHQPTNLANFLIEDIKITDNSVSTLVDLYSYKARSGKSAGTTYSEIPGDIYKKNSNTFHAIMGYVENLKRYYEMTLSNKKTKLATRYLLPTLRDERASNQSAGLHSYNFEFNRRSSVNNGLKLCAMEGSVSYEYVLQKEPSSKFFLDLIAKSYILSKENPDFNNSIAINTVARQAVNNSNAAMYSPEMTPLSDNNKTEISSEKHDDKMIIDAAKFNHAVQTKLNVYADKLPGYLTNQANFSARVGDEIFALSSKLKDSLEILTTEELRKKLGISTTQESECAQLADEVNSIMIQASLQNNILDDTGFIYNKVGATIILRHPITIALIKGKIEAIDSQIETLEYSNDNLVTAILSKRMFLSLILDEAFSPSEIRESDKKYKNVNFPFSDILV